MVACYLLAADHNGTQVPEITSLAWQHHRGWAHRVAELLVQAKCATCEYYHLSGESTDSDFKVVCLVP